HAGPHQIAWAGASADVTEFLIHLEAAAKADGPTAIAALAAATALYRGEFLQGIWLPDAEDYEEWLQARRTNLAEKALDALARLARLRLDAGDNGGAIEAAPRGGDCQPLR